jgi:hypothetical protein
MNHRNISLSSSFKDAVNLPDFAPIRIVSIESRINSADVLHVEILMTPELWRAIDFARREAEDE